MYLLDQYRFFIEIEGSLVRFYPVNPRLEYTWEKERDQIFYRRTLNTALVFENDVKRGIDDYTKLIEIEKTCDRCVDLPLTILIKCGQQEWQPDFNGLLRLSDAKVNESKCTIEISVITDDQYACYDRIKGREVNILEGLPKRTTEFYLGTVNVARCPFGIDPGSQIGFPFQDELLFEPSVFSNLVLQDWCIDNPLAGWTILWAFVYNIQEQANGLYSGLSVTTWAREEIFWANDGTTPPGGGWILADILPGDNVAVFGRPIPFIESDNSFYADTKIYLENAFRLDTDVVDEDGEEQQIAIDKLDNGVLLNDVIELLFADCEKEIISNFFSLNPDGTNPNSEVYQTAIEKLAYIFVYQKTDIKNPNAYENATRGIWTLEGLMRDLYEMFQVYWIIDGDTIRIEHISYFNEQQGLNLTELKYQKSLRGTEQYSYVNANQPQFERWSWMDRKNYDNVFDGRDIEYTDCEKKGEVENHDVSKVTTDIGWIIGSPESIEDDGFVFVATDYWDVTDSYYINKDEGIPNYHLSFENLINTYWLHDRYQFRAKYGDEDIIFESTKRCKEQTEITVPFCCDDWLLFNPIELVKTQYGWGEIDKAEYNTQLQCLTLTILHDCGCLPDRGDDDPKCFKINPLILIDRDEGGCVWARIGGDTQNQPGQFLYSTDGGTTYNPYSEFAPICGQDEVIFKYEIDSRDCGQIEVERTINIREVCGDNQPEIILTYDEATNCISATLGGTIVTPILGTTWEYSTDGGTTWQSYTTPEQVCNFFEITFRATIDFDTCPDIVIEESFTAPPPICQNQPVLRCVEQDNGCITFEVDGINSDPFIITIQYQIDGGTWLTYTGEPICAGGTINAKAIIHYCDDCPPQCVETTCEVCTPFEAGTPTPKLFCI